MIIPNLCDYIKLIQVLYLLNIWIIRFFLSFYFTILLFRYSLTMPFLECLVLIYYTISVCVKFVVAWSAHTKKNVLYAQKITLQKFATNNRERDREAKCMTGGTRKKRKKKNFFDNQNVSFSFLIFVFYLFIYYYSFTSLFNSWWWY